MTLEGFMSIYDQHRAAFANVDACVVMLGEDRVATIAFKYGASVTAYVHWIGTEMQRGRAGGGGYDRKSAACADAARKMPAELSGAYDDGTQHHSAREQSAYAAFRASLKADNGFGWDHNLEQVGFKVWRAI